jgi:hypothetical protein
LSWYTSGGRGRAEIDPNKATIPPNTCTNRPSLDLDVALLHRLPLYYIQSLCFFFFYRQTD